MHDVTMKNWNRAKRATRKLYGIWTHYDVTRWSAITSHSIQQSNLTCGSLSTSLCCH